MHLTGSQEVEGINSIVKIHGARDPHISLELLSARLTIRRELKLTDHVNRNHFKWNDKLGTCVKLLDTVREFSYEGSLLRATVDRWSSPSLIDLICQWLQSSEMVHVCGLMPFHQLVLQEIGQRQCLASSARSWHRVSTLTSCRGF